jgi:hypothetical protein
MKPLLVTFGCSWTYGVGVGYEPGMSNSEFTEIERISDICNQYSFRGLLSSKYNLENKNFAHGMASNQRQFRLAKEFFTSSEFDELKNKHSKIIVLHAITSTARNEMFIIEKNNMVSFKYDLKLSQPTNELSKAILTYSYNHENEVAQLATEMKFWNKFYSLNNISNLWIDTFNHHDYPGYIDNMLGMDENPRDMLSKLALSADTVKLDNLYHLSSRKQDTNRITTTIKSGLSNPFSTHPTKEGHKRIANIISKSLEPLL